MTAIQEVSITTEHGTFVGPNMRAVKKLAAAASEKEKVESAARVARIETAMERARGNGFRLMRAKWYADGDKKKIGPFDFVPLHHRAFQSLARVDDNGSDDPHRAGRRITIHFADGDAVYHFGHRVSGVVMRGDGYPMAVFTQNDDGTDALHAVGNCGECCQAEIVPGVVIEDFTVYPE